MCTCSHFDMYVWSDMYVCACRCQKTDSGVAPQFTVFETGLLLAWKFHLGSASQVMGLQVHHHAQRFYVGSRDLTQSCAAQTLH